MQVRLPDSSPTLSPVSVMATADAQAIPMAPSPPAQVVESPARERIYIVRPGDTLRQLAPVWGTTVSEIAALNRLPNPSLILVGQLLQIPGR